jgi:hypothetical protein
MGRPLSKKYFGNRNVGTTGTTDDKIGGEGIASIALGAANNSASYTAGLTQISIATPTIPTGVRAVGSLVVGPAGAFLTAAAGTSGTDRSTFTATGTGTSATGTYTGLVQKATNGSGTGAVFTITKATTGTNYATGGVLTVITATTKGTGYAVGNTITIDGALIGGVTSTNDIVLTVVGAVAAAGTITGITITEKGSGYTTAPAVTLSTGTQGTLTVTAALTVNTGNVGSTTYQENAIIMTAFLTGGSATTVDIIKQVSTNRFKVTDGTRTGIVKLKSSVATAAGEGSIKFTDSVSGTYFATKITARKATVTRGTGTAFATGAAVKWNMNAAVLGDSLLVENA